jgi:hypothetical protein
MGYLMGYVNVVLQYMRVGQSVNARDMHSCVGCEVQNQVLHVLLLWMKG